MRRSISLFSHQIYRKSVPTFRSDALKNGRSDKGQALILGAGPFFLLAWALLELGKRFSPSQFDFNFAYPRFIRGHVQKMSEIAVAV